MTKNRRFRRNSLKRDKARRVSELNTSRINKRKYYGLQTEINEFKETLEYHFTHTSVIDQIRDGLAGLENNTRKEDVANDIVNSTDFMRNGQDEAINDLRPNLESSFKKGSRRAFDSQGDSLEAPDNMEAQVNQIVNKQRNYLSKLDQDLREKALQIIRDGVAAGLTVSAIITNLRAELDNLIDNRSSTIANSEVIAAGTAGTLATFKANGVSEVVWVSSQDDNVCEPGNFRVTYNGSTYTSCRELDGEAFNLTGNFPQPVLQSHPNCRCTLVSNDD